MLFKYIHVHDLGNGWIHIQNLEKEVKPKPETDKIPGVQPMQRSRERMDTDGVRRGGQALSAGTSNGSLPGPEVSSPETIHSPCL